MDVTSLTNLLTQAISTLPVLLTIVAVQLIKFNDKARKFKNHYFTFSLLIGLGLGILYSTGFSPQGKDWLTIIRDGVQTCLFASFAIALKKALKIVLPGDDPLPTSRKKGQSD